MDNFSEKDELDETSALFVIGEDRWQGPVLVARPCMHHSTTRQESIRAAKLCVNTLQRCVERMPAGVEKATIIYDAKGLQGSNLDLVFARELISAIANHYPQRTQKILVINNHWTMSFFWHAISVLLDATTKSNIVFCGMDFRETLSHFVEESHEYVQYALSLKGLSTLQCSTVSLPKSSPYVPRWREAVAADACLSDDDDLLPDYESEWSRQTSPMSTISHCSRHTRLTEFSSISTRASDEPVSPKVAPCKRVPIIVSL